MELKYKKLWVSFLLVASFLPSVTPCWTDSSSPYATEWNQNKNMCGTFSDNGKIVNGAGSNTYIWPWVGFMYINHGGVTNLCAVELIAPEWATTAAHCVNGGVLAHELTITFGQTHRTSSSFYTQVKRVQEIILEPNYSASGHRNDIAVLHLRTAVTYDSRVRPVCMQAPDPYWDNVYDNCWVAGWGRLSSSGSTANQLQELKVDILDNSACDDYWSFIDDNHICASGVNPNSGICNGDSGGPLMCRINEKQWILLGITSFVKSNDCGSTYPDGFTRVSSFSQWITDVIDARGGPN